ncbi:asparagine synthase (glutamine-hydrolysing) [Mucilaginibacter yixingensis]|uniref:asparagine synthase (glutamine-hydrolyzing) n=1 Tax=Mucilaginibacter yixingensis TaxID=1295612 RepID=A0A2T5J9J5_9SPHI|nr:asparagine synthase (glutamine-hydrolyzing) [Mucilaginibacter yixingensis]PTQ96679.1 asparagine synthase (glutamine-hydrolysing) [Mucilaginibacter yixingensis]
MCGIYGTTGVYSDQDITAKLNLMRFRGPDYSDFRRVGPVTVGHNRLAIVDLDKRSNQPFTYQHLTIVFNGEVYNYLALKENLIKIGYSFSTDSDTEVITAAYLAYGDRCVEYFNGMFAFVIYDSKTNSFFGARDRLGKKPFYYMHAAGGFEFSSQPAALARNKNLTTDTEALNRYFIWGYVPEPASAWNEIKKIPAGCSFRYHIDKDHLTIKKYWEMTTENGSHFQGNYQDAKNNLSSLLDDAVKIRLGADVSLGVFLSGGIDSSLIAALAARHISKPKTFSVQFTDKNFDESSYAADVAKYLKTDHHTVVCDVSEGLSLIQDFGKYYDEPFADPSAIPSLLLSKYTKSMVTVALSGDGGDESFMGYTRYRWLNHADNLFKCPLPVRKWFSSLLSLAPNDKIQRIAQGLRTTDTGALYALMLGGLNYEWLDNPEAGLAVPFMDVWSKKDMSFLQKMSVFDIKTYLNGDINTKVDRATMAFAIEARAPLMDYRIVNFAQQLPVDFKFKANNQKRILKDVLYDLVPAHYFDRPKRGFSIPIRHWFRNELKEYVLDELSASSLKNIPGVNVQAALTMIQEHLSGKHNRSLHIWKLLVFKQWQQNQRLKLSVNPAPPIIRPSLTV